MKRILFFLITFALSLEASTAKTTLSVMELTASGVPKEEAKTLTSLLISNLAGNQSSSWMRKSRESWFSLVATEKRDKILKEWAFQQSGVCDQASCISEFGKALGVQMMVGGNVGKIGDAYSLNIILVDVATSEVKESFLSGSGCHSMECLSSWIPSLVTDIVMGSYAEKVCQKEVEQNPNDADAHNNLGLALENKGKIGGRPGDGIHWGYVPVGLTLQNKWISEKAVNEFRKAVQLDSTFAEAHFNLGGALESAGNYSEAETEYQIVMRLNPKLGKKGFRWLGLGRFNYGVKLRDQGKTEEAISAYREAIRLDPQSGFSYNNLGLLLAQKGEYKEAEELLREAIFIDERDASHFESLGIILEMQNKRKEAKEYWEKAMQYEKDPKQIERIKELLAEPDY